MAKVEDPSFVFITNKLIGYLFKQQQRGIKSRWGENLVTSKNYRICNYGTLLDMRHHIIGDFFCEKTKIITFGPILTFVSYF